MWSDKDLVNNFSVKNRIVSLASMKFSEQIKRCPLVLDGALGTQIEIKYKEKLQESQLNIQAHPLWSALILLLEPQLIKQIHYDYLEAGANIILTLTYQASKKGLLQHAPELVKHEEDVLEVYKKAVLIACEAKADYLKSNHTKPIYIAGSIGPFGGFLANGAEYTGNYSGHINKDSDLKDFHYDIAKSFIEDENCDILAFETVPNFTEFQQILELMAELLQKKEKQFYISLNFKDSKHICDGTPLTTVIDHLNEKITNDSHLQRNFVGLGFNCIAFELVGDVLQSINDSNTLNLPIIAYPNIGLLYDLSKGEYTLKNATNGDFDICLEWIEKYNVRVIGGCCGSGPSEIKSIKNVISKYSLE